MYTKTHRSVFGELLKRRRNSLNLTQAEVAAAVGWSTPEMVSQVEVGRRHPALDRVPDLAAVLALDAGKLCVALLQEIAPRFLASLNLPIDQNVAQPFMEAVG